MNNLEDRVRSGLHETAERIPETGTRVVDHGARKRRPAGIWMGAAAVVGVLVLFGPLLFLNSQDPEPPLGAEPAIPTTAAPGTTTTAALGTTTPADEPTPEYLDRFPVVVEVEETGDLIGLERGHAFMSTDGGESWSEILVSGGADLVDLTPDGRVIAISNAEHEDSTDALGPDSSVRPAPKVHFYDPVIGEWVTTELPRPEFPVDDPVSVPIAGSGSCPIGGIQWTMDAISIAISDRYVVAGEQRITEATICDESHQLFWTSDDGETWSITEPTGIPGYMVGLTWFDGTYVAYGSQLHWYSVNPDKTVEIWTSGDLADWESAEIDLSMLPENAYPAMFPDEERTWGLGGTVQSTVTDGLLRLVIPIGVAAPGPDPDIADLDELNQWAEKTRRISIEQETLDSLAIDFPLDDEEVKKLTGFFQADEGHGLLTLETEDGVTWSTQYES
jgi:hypothetical protein